jgi:DNA-directed RNA polymerase subunit RPC12/RpoP
MALIKCSECEHQVSTNAVNCPHCGNIIQINEPKKERKGFAWYVYLLVAIAVIYMASQCGDTKSVGLAQHEKAYIYDWRPVKSSEFGLLGRIIVANNIKVCGEYQVKYLDDNTYLLGCTPDGYTWYYYYLYTVREKVTYLDSDTESKINPPR